MLDERDKAMGIEAKKQKQSKSKSKAFGAKKLSRKRKQDAVSSIVVEYDNL